MSSFNADTKQSWAAAAVSGVRGTPKEATTGVVSTEAKWERVRRQIARTYITDPDCVFYQAYLVSNRLYGVARELSKSLDSLAQYAEGSAYKSSTAPTLPQLPGHVVGATSTEALAEYQSVLAGRAKAAASSTKIGRRLAEKGDEARSLYLQELNRFLPVYFDFQVSLSRLADCNPDFEPLRKLAAADVLPSADRAVGQTYTSGGSAAFAVQNAAAAAALLAVNRVPTISLRTKYVQEFWPSDTKYAFTGTTVTWSVGSPALCYVRAGDRVSWASGAATVTAVDSTSVTVDLSLSGATTLTIEPGPYAALLVLQEACAKFLTENDVADDLLRIKLLSLETVSDIRTVVSFISQLQARILGVSTDMDAVLTRMGLATPIAAAIASEFKAYNPAIPSTTKTSTKACLSLLEQEGLGLPMTRFLQGDLTFLSEPVDDQQPSTFFKRAISNMRGI